MAEQSAKLQVSELDYIGIKSNLVAFLKSQSEFSNFDFAGSGLDVIMDLLSYNTYYNSFYLNMLANEMFLDTAELRNSVVQKAKQIGYRPKIILSGRKLNDNMSKHVVNQFLKSLLKRRKKIVIKK